MFRAKTFISRFDVPMARAFVVFYPPDGGYNNVIPPGFKTSFANLCA
jgi:hypothetical protein